MLQRAGRMEGRARTRRQPLAQRRRVRRHHFGDILDQRHDPGGALGVVRVSAQMVRILLHHGAATRGVHDDGLDLAALDPGPPGVDVGAHLRQGLALRVQVEVDGAATARARRQARADANGVEHAQGGGVDGGHHGRLHAAGQHQHLALMARRIGQQAGRPRRRHLAPQRLRQHGAHHLAQPHGRAEPGRIHASAQRFAAQPVAQPARYALVDQLAADIDQPPILHPRWTGRFAIAAGQAAVQVLLGGLGRLAAFEQLLDQVDAAARTVQLVAQYLVGRTRSGTETAMHATAQDGIGLLAEIGIACPRSKICLHGARVSSSICRS
ncbi:Uncharacterised protein [Bordetella pertussis]|nr:Uncharacterised protein [Bordetella pertussis]CPL81377.1 Uncharacterised protein [Bordetella pertussis]CPO34953.1 Uncharacterised protein [Bordetella pertussis]